MARLGRSPERIGFTALDLQRMFFPPIKYVVTGYIVEGLTLLAGRPKRGKSWLLLHAAIAVAMGGYTLGDVQCVQGDVLYAALEDNKRRLQSRLAKLLPGTTQDWPERLHFETEMPRLKDGGLDMVRRWIEQVEEPRLVIIDTLQKVRDAKSVDQNGYEADYAAVSELKALADRHGVAIVLVHHQRKMDAEDPVDTVSGTTGLTGAVDTVLVLNNAGQGMTLYGRGRDIEEIEKAVTFDKDLCIWRVEGEAGDVRRSDERSAIIGVLEESAEPLTPREIADLAELSYASIRMMRTRMVKSGEIERKGRGCYIAASKTPCDNGYNSCKGGADEDGL
ncbi:MAG TPA: AAA family ATPase [Sphingomicrobium sp.]|nr:AAA family ATPase [Sphingomicrobium sp.]